VTAPGDLPIAVFAYNRPHLLARTLDCLREAGARALVVFSDGPRTEEDASLVAAVRALVRRVQWTTPELVERPTNLGNTGSVVDGLQAMLARHDRVVVLEDDIAVAPEFLSFVAAALDTYAEDAPVAGVTGLRLPFSRRPLAQYPYDAFLLPRFFVWGWATWRRAWETFDFDGERVLERLRRERPRLDVAGADLPYMVRAGLVQRTLAEPWDVCVAASMVLNGQRFVVPTWNMVENTGLGSGTHPHRLAWELRLEAEHRPTHAPLRFPPPSEVDRRILRAFQVFRENPRGWTARRLVPRPVRVVMRRIRGTHRIPG
jgi:hypothetical protein